MGSRRRRHRSLLNSDTSRASFAAAIVFATWLIWELVGDAPTALNSLLGIAGGALFAAYSSDKRQRDVDDQRSATDEGRAAGRAEGRAEATSGEDVT